MQIAEMLGRVLIITGFAIGTGVGFCVQSLFVSVIIWAIGIGLAIIVHTPVNYLRMTDQLCK